MEYYRIFYEANQLIAEKIFGQKHNLNFIGFSAGFYSPLMFCLIRCADINKHLIDLRRNREYGH
jgi:hypothetical protein